MISKILGLFVNALTADDEYPLLKMENLLRRIKIQLSKKQKVFSGFFAAFLKFTSNLEPFEK